jgi:hypothetical protein
MWKLIYEDTFGFGEDRDPPKVEKTGNDGQDGFFQLWTNVLEEEITFSNGKFAVGFARFTLLIDLPDEKAKSISIEVGRYINRLTELKQEANQNKIKKIATDHYEACLKNEEESFWNNFNQQRKVFKVVAVNIGKDVYLKKSILFLLLIIFANIMFLFCLLSMFYLFSLQKPAESIIVGIFALVFLAINLTVLNIKELRLRYKYPEKFYIEIDGTNFIHSNGNFVKKINLKSIRDIREEEIISRGGFHAMFVVNYTENDKIKTYSFFKAFSKNDIVYNIPADKINAYVK